MVGNSSRTLILMALISFFPPSAGRAVGETSKLLSNIALNEAAERKDEKTGTDGTTVYEVPADIPADLSEDVTARLQAFFDSVPDGCNGLPGHSAKQMTFQ